MERRGDVRHEYTECMRRKRSKSATRATTSVKNIASEAFYVQEMRNKTLLQGGALCISMPLRKVPESSAKSCFRRLRD
jgi:hypothetical protein